MHSQAKHARFNLIVCIITILITTAAYLAISVTLSSNQARGALGLLGFLGFLGIGRVFYRKQVGEEGVVLDERDKEIRNRAQLVAWRVVWFYWCLVCMGPFFWVMFKSGLAELEKPFIPVELLPWSFMAAFIVFTITWSISILTHYRFRGLESEE